MTIVVARVEPGRLGWNTRGDGPCVIGPFGAVKSVEKAGTTPTISYQGLFVTSPSYDALYRTRRPMTLPPIFCTKVSSTMTTVGSGRASAAVNPRPATTGISKTSKRLTEISLGRTVTMGPFAVDAAAVAVEASSTSKDANPSWPGKLSVNVTAAICGSASSRWANALVNSGS